MKLIATLVLMAGLVGCDSTKDSSETQVKQQISYAQIIPAVPVWDRTVLNQATDNQLIVIIVACGIIGSSLLYGLRELLDTIRSHKQENPVCGSIAADTADYAYVQAQITHYEDERVLAPFSEKMDAHTLTKGDVARVRSITADLDD